jgi:hypothetical protein
MRLIRVSVGIGAFVLTASVAGLFAQAPAQGGAPGAAGGRGQAPPSPQNLQVLSKDISREELIATMRGYTAGLGVQCNYCHVQEGRGGRNDFATDEKAPKKTARVMITMMNHVNETLARIRRHHRLRHRPARRQRRDYSELTCNSEFHPFQSRCTF